MGDLIEKPYKDKEFKAFIQAINDGQVGHWVEIAHALNISEDTVVKWKKIPEAQEAIQKGIDYALQCMQQAGSRDWRMWEAKLKMLGVNPTTKVDVTVAVDPRKEILNKYLGGDDAGQATDTTS